MYEDYTTIETPEHIQVHYELAGVGSRILAGILDTALQVILTLLVVVALVWLGNTMGWMDAYGLAAGIGVAALGYLSAVAYFVTCEMLMNGQSPGKRLAGLRVVRLDGTPIRFLDSALRNILRGVDMIPFLYTVGLVAIFLSPRSQRLGDMAAGTLVIKERLEESSLLAATEGDLLNPAPPPGLSPEAQARLQAALHLLKPAETAAAQRFSERRHELAPAVRTQLARDLAAPLLARLPEAVAADYESPEAFLVALAALAGQVRL
jgi:uncharacterized RDD family membrane protein YckC